jgi:hypothetical protein
MSKGHCAEAQHSSRDRQTHFDLELGSRKVNFKWISHQLTSGEKRKRLEIARELLRFRESASIRTPATIFTGDEIWFYFSNARSSMWIGVDIPHPIRVKQTIGTTKIRHDCEHFQSPGTRSTKSYVCKSFKASP